MVKKFEFRDQSTDIEIAGKTFSLDVTSPSLLRRIEKFGREAVAQSFIDEDDDYITQLEKSIDFMQHAIDQILGEGAAKEIFGDREVSFLEMLDLINFLRDTVLEARKEKLSKYSADRVKRVK